MKIHIRFYRDRYNMDVGYYTGDEDIVKRFCFDDADDLRRCWKALLHTYEGETYSAWYGRGCDELLCGGAFDSNDLDDIIANYRELEAKGA